MLLPKARLALRKYQHDLVIANLLEERKHRVILISRTDAPAQTIELGESATGEIEQLIVNCVLQLYKAKGARSLSQLPSPLPLSVASQHHGYDR